MIRPRVAVLCGGWTEEREVSLESGRKALEALHEAGFEPLGFHLTRKGDAKAEGPLAPLPRDEILPLLRKAGAEVAFLAFHGRLGEDGTVQGVLELGGIPYTGSGVLASSLAMDKAMAKRVFQWHGIPTPPFRVWTQGQPAAGDPEPPVVTKPVTGGSTIGVTRVMSPAGLGAGLEEALCHDSRVLVRPMCRGGS